MFRQILIKVSHERNGKMNHSEKIRTAAKMKSNNQTFAPYWETNKHDESGEPKAYTEIIKFPKANLIDLNKSATQASVPESAPTPNPQRQSNPTSGPVATKV